MTRNETLSLGPGVGSRPKDSVELWEGSERARYMGVCSRKLVGGHLQDLAERSWSVPEVRLDVSDARYHP